MNIDDSSLKILKYIINFVNELANVFEKKQKTLLYYKRLINKLGVTHEVAIKKHLACMSDFCIQNRECIQTKNTNLVKNEIKYSDNVYINMKHIFSMADDETKDTIWNHLLTISSFLDPAGNAKEILRKNLSEGKNNQSETDFLTNIISKVENHVGDDANPMSAVSSIMQSGILNELVNDLGSKKMDINKLLGAVQGMVASLSENATDPESKRMVDMLSSTTTMLANPNGSPPDMAGMLQSMTSLMTASAGIHDSSNDKKE
jgi:hypothetical protein